jgi:hypothetical protein
MDIGDNVGHVRFQNTNISLKKNNIRDGISHVAFQNTDIRLENLDIRRDVTYIDIECLEITCQDIKTLKRCLRHGVVQYVVPQD